MGMIKLLGELAAIPPWAILLGGFALPALEASSWLGLVVPGSLAVLLGGALAHEGRVSLVAVMAAAVSGAVLGDNVGYALGVRFGSVLFHSDRARRRLRRAQAFVHRYGGLAILLGHWAAFLGTVVPSIAGASGIPYRRFLAKNLISGLTWGIGLAGIGYLACGAYRRVEEAMGLSGVAATFVVLLIVLAGTHQLRRREASRPRRNDHGGSASGPGPPDALSAHRGDP
jgi:undecaprenyl-diphosphatase